MLKSHGEKKKTNLHLLFKEFIDSESDVQIVKFLEIHSSSVLLTSKFLNSGYSSVMYKRYIKVTMVAAIPGITQLVHQLEVSHVVVINVSAGL